ncbi:GroES-like protein [Irpex lacteus]|nr:GroES-like protein [Irpex lacteus]
MSTLPDKQIGLLTANGEIKFQEFPVPSPGPNEVLVQNVAVASNPKDWKVPKWIENYSGVEGNDVAGYIVKDPRSGAYIQYSIAPASTTFRIPESTSFEEASTLPLALGTAFIGLFKRLALPETPSGEKQGVIINGAASSVGAYAVQLAKRAGLFIIGVAGSSKDYAKSLGADIIVDYREHQGEALAEALIKASEGHNVSHISTHDEENKQIPAGIDIERTGVNTVYGEDEEFAARWYRQVAQWLAPSASNPTPFQPNRVKVLPNGLASVPEGLKLLEEGKVHAEKLVYRITETPQLQSK